MSEAKFKILLTKSIPLVLISGGYLLSGCSEESSNVTSSVTPSDDNDKLASTESRQQTLTVSPERCRGCGRCQQIDPDHFIMSGRVAVVISNENLSSRDLTLAIASCPDDAIEII